MLPIKQISVMGVSFRTANAAVRESLNFDRDEASELLKAWTSEEPDTEGVILSTCNRTEFYFASTHPDETAAALRARLRRLRPRASIADDACRRYEWTGSAAVRHLLRVACGLDSAILGDTQILGQIRTALSWSTEAGTVGKYFSRLFARALQTGGEVRRTTNISHGTANIGSAVAGMIAGLCQAPRVPADLAVLILGAGEVASACARQLHKLQIRKLTIANRTAEKSIRLAAACCAKVAEWGNLEALLDQVDVVVAATSAPQPILTRQMLQASAGRRNRSLLTVIDAGLPRNVEPTPQVNVIGIDAIRERREEVFRVRQNSLPAVEQRVDEALLNWHQWQSLLPVESSIQLLFAEAGDLTRRATEDRPCSRECNCPQMEQALSRSIKRLLHRHARRLRELTRSVESLPHREACAGFGFPRESREPLQPHSTYFLGRDLQRSKPCAD